MTERTAPSGHHTWWWLRTVAYVVLCVFMSVSGVVFTRTAEATDGWSMAANFLGLLAALAMPVTLFWRRRAPLAVTLGATAVALLLPIGTSTALVALAGLVARRRGREVWWTVAAVTAVTVVSAIRDVAGPTKDTSLFKQVFAPTSLGGDVPFELSWWVVGIWVVVFLAGAVGAGLVLRSRREVAVASQQVVEVSETSGRLGDQLARQVERERIAREVHDVLGHRLSLLNLHAGALETRATADPELAESAKLVRESARSSMEDLRSLLGVLRHPLGGEPAAPALTLVDLPTVIEETVTTGVPVSSTIFLDGAEQAGPTLSRAVYRIVQELLTNARKHAAGEQIRLSVSGGPVTGVTIDARNRYLGPVQGPAGHGLQGVAERVELLGGTLVYGLDDGGRTFRVTVQLPWSTS
ncbi:sensor histidine kinase [Georgenia subflava]|uniref:histidine kinase n=1 Tax=Georgenia subflava TaxID=1622177 RepID=A0A6N7EIF2_9MICO|nr:histidine kinase [Georgenia subflava]MPV37850.1 two-component sensor histidine kinase [Georgenia subflava]